jgi:hypothetical protein
MSLEQYKDASRKELWEILQIQAEEFKFIEKQNAEMVLILREFLSALELNGQYRITQASISEYLK